jgi:large subunit ribosomal protein L19
MEREVMDKIKTGTKVKVFEKIKEGSKERVGFFEGIVIARKHGSEKRATFTVRGKLGEYGLEKTYPVHSPLISKVEIISTPKKVRRSKLYYIRDLSARRIKEKIGQSS